MRYANPSIDNELKRIQQQGYSKIVVLPLYPQYAGPTTGSTFDAIYKQVKQWRWIPSIHFISGYYDHELYIQALANSVQQDFAKHGKPEKLILSYHGMPKRFLEQGDPYFCMCQKTSRLLAQRLQLSDSEFITTFQSRFGKAEWLKPYTDKTLEELAGCGIKNIAIMSPAFSADCLETIEELEEENKEIFIDAGGEQYRYIKALNHDADHIQMMAALIKPYL
jgi:ferrochelatase